MKGAGRTATAGRRTGRVHGRTGRETVSAHSRAGRAADTGKRVLMLASVASMIDQFNMPNIRLLQEMGCEVHVACNFRKGNTCDAAQIRKLTRRLDGMGVCYFQWDCPRNVYAAGRCMKAFRQLWRLTGAYRYDMIHCHSPVGGALARIVAHYRKIPVIYTAHGFHFYKGAPVKNWLLYYPAEKLLAHWTDALITVNKEDYAFAKRNLSADRIYRIPGVGIDTARFSGNSPGQMYGKPESSGGSPESENGKPESSGGSPAPDGGGAQNGTGGGTRSKTRRAFREKYRIPQDAVLLLSVGELNKGKNHRYVLDALARLCRGTRRKYAEGKREGSARPAELYYMICGRGKLRGRLLRHASRKGIRSRVRMPGFVARPADAYAASDIFVFPSRREGMPVALLEAMAAGLPCVVSDIRGCRELVSGAGPIPGTGRTGGCRVRLGHPDGLASALAWLAGNPALRKQCGRYNRKRSAAYDVSLVEGKMRRIYRNFL